MEKKPTVTPSPFDNMPNKCGVYIMKDENKKILYIGKAIDIKKRMLSYKSGREDVRLQIPFLLEKVRFIETFITFTEKEALILENTLIKKHKPKYNVLLKDDKNYNCLAIKKDSPYPRISIERYPIKKDGDYIVSKPFVSSLLAKAHFEILRRSFKLRSCTDMEFKSRSRPCILYNIDKCSAPCVKKCKKADYTASVTSAKLYLKGDTAKVTSYLKEEMLKASKNLQFERANHFHNMLLAIEKTSKKAITVTTKEDADALAIIRRSGFCIIYKLVFRKGLLIDGSHYSFSSVASNTCDTLTAFILQHYEEIKDKPKYIYVPETLLEEKDLSELLNIKIRTPKIGSKNKLLELALENAKEVFEREALSEDEGDSLLQSLKDKLSLKRTPAVIDCLDTSNLGGKDAVAAVVVFKNGVPDKTCYRNYHIDSSKYADDISAMKETITRRYGKLETLPDLILIDGGKGQLGILEKTLKELNIIDVEIAALTKEESRHDKGLTKERVFIKGQKTAIIFDRHSSLLFFLQNIRDEAHRRAISFHRKKKRKSAVISALDGIPGIGPKKKQLLLKTFGSVKGIREASPEDLSLLNGINSKNIKMLKELL